MEAYEGGGCQHWQLLEDFGMVNRDLAIQREENKLQEAALRQREQGLKAKDLELQSSIVQFAKYLSSNEAKRVRARARLEEEEAAERASRRRLQAVAADLEAAKATAIHLQVHLHRIQKYQEFLVSAAEHSGGAFSSADAIMERYGTVQRVWDDAVGQRKQVEAELWETRERERQAALQSTEERRALEAKLEALSFSCQMAARSAHAAEAGVFAVQGAHDAVVRDAWAAESAVRAMYARVCACSKLGHNPGEQALDVQLAAVAQFICDMRTALDASAGNEVP